MQEQSLLISSACWPTSETSTKNKYTQIRLCKGLCTYRLTEWNCSRKRRTELGGATTSLECPKGTNTTCMTQNWGRKFLQQVHNFFLKWQHFLKDSVSLKCIKEKGIYLIYILVPNLITIIAKILYILAPNLPSFWSSPQDRPVGFPCAILHSPLLSEIMFFLFLKQDGKGGVGWPKSTHKLPKYL